jgi:hypothetical protein
VTSGTSLACCRVSGATIRWPSVQAVGSRPGKGARHGVYDPTRHHDRYRRPSALPWRTLPRMTVAVVVKVFDGIVLAADSATTLTLQGGGHQVYNNANKVFHLHRTLPVGAMTWGLGNIGSASISTLAKDLRRRLMGRDPAHVDWLLDAGTYTVQGVADRLVELIYELYVTEFAGIAVPPGRATLGFLVAGYSAEAKESEGWLILIDGTANRPVPELAIGPDQAGYLAYAQPDATLRLFNGFDPNLPAMIEAALEPHEWAKVQALLAAGVLQRQPVVPGMPFADAIAFARYLVDVTAGYSHYLLGPDTVGGPVEVAGISRHEGFKWISRKHYYSAQLNPEEPGHAY